MAAVPMSALEGISIAWYSTVSALLTYVQSFCSCSEGGQLMRWRSQKATFSSTMTWMASRSRSNSSPCNTTLKWFKLIHHTNCGDECAKVSAPHTKADLRNSCHLEYASDYLLGLCKRTDRIYHDVCTSCHYPTPRMTVSRTASTGMQCTRMCHSHRATLYMRIRTQ